MNSFKEHSSTLLAALLLAGGAFFLGYIVGTDTFSQTQKPAIVANTDSEIETEADFAAFWKAWNVLEEKYVPAQPENGEVNAQEKVWGAIQGLAFSLGDPYTTFFPPVESSIFEADISGNFEGVGMEVGAREGILTVISPLKGTPADKAGIKPGDQIIEIDGETTLGLTLDEAVTRIRGEKGSTVVFTIVREGEEATRRISVVRDVIDIPTIDTEMRGGVFILRLYNFSALSPQMFRDALREFILSDSNKLVLDLRGNPGGFLDASVDIASWFLPAGKIIVQEDSSDGEPKKYRSKGYNVFSDELEMIVLIDQGSASASEILAGALKEHDIATLVGMTTFGKGSVQELVKITPETSLKVTVARWLTPDGNSFSEIGIEPDIEVAVTEEDILSGKDPQLERALQILAE